MRMCGRTARCHRLEVFSTLIDRAVPVTVICSISAGASRCNGFSVVVVVHLVEQIGAERGAAEDGGASLLAYS